jgi:hypothetical protein
MVAEIAALDLWTLFVQYVFGGFWIAVVGLAIVQFVIMGVLGRISIYSVTWYMVMFLLAMTLGYGFVILNTFITLALLIGFFFSWKSYIDSK